MQGSDQECDLVEQAYQYVTTRVYPEGCSDTRKRTIRKKAKKFEVKEGELFYKQKCREKVSPCSFVFCFFTL